MAQDRRQAPRIPIQLRAVVHCEAREIPAEVRNVSTGGAFVATWEKLPLGATLNVSFVHRGEPVTAAGHVAYASDEGAGIAWEEPSAKFSQALAEIIQEQVDAGNAPISRRRSERVEGRIALLFADADGYRVGFTQDLSDHGAFLCADRHELGDDPFPLTLSEHGLFDCYGRVARRMEQGTGIEFLQPDKPFMLAVKRIIIGLLGLRG